MRNKLSTFLAILCGLVVVIIFFIYSDISIEKNYTLEEKNIVYKDDQFYLLVDSRELILSEYFYEKLDFKSSNEYKVKYSYRSFGKEGGKVMFLERYIEDNSNK